MKELNTALLNYISDPKNDMYNFKLATIYEQMGYTAAAASFYIRTSEFSFNMLLIYEALLRLGLCFEKQGSRVFTTKGIFLRAVSLLPKRPEAYFLLSRIYEHNRDWQEAYTMAIIGESLIDEPLKPLLTDVEYPGKYGFTFERAVTAWWIGLIDESLTLFRQLSKNTKLLDVYKNVTKNNLINLGTTDHVKAPLVYNNSLYEHLRFKFKGASEIQENYSQCYQDMFVLTMLNGKKYGKYIEIGCADPFYGNNTALLEKQFEWTGISIDFDQSQINKYPGVRDTQTICADATKIDYVNLLKDNDNYDYLQLDCDPAITTFEVLMRIPFEKHKFAVITFEHDYYADENSQVREKSRKYLESQGYELVVANIAPNKYNSYEDWWVHPDLVNNTMINKIKDISDEPKKADEFMLGKKWLIE